MPIVEDEASDSNTDDEADIGQVVVRRTRRRGRRRQGHSVRASRSKHFDQGEPPPPPSHRRGGGDTFRETEFR